MKGSNYLNWFRRLLVLGAVVAFGVLTASAGAQAGPPSGHVAIPAWLSKIHYPGTSYPFNSVGIPASLARTHYPGTSYGPASTSLVAPVGAAATTPLPAASYYTKQQLQAMSQSWAAKAALSSLTPQERQALLQVVTANTPAVQTPATSGFGWGDFGFGAASMIGLLLVVGGCVLAGRHTRRGSGVPARVGA